MVGDHARPARATVNDRLHRAGTPPRRSIEVADTVTEMRKVKHAYDTGVMAKKGIDY